ncbi:MAG: hypothetical protein KDA65_12385 [Planctomycetaceae bacterium]|nr:hypothetical protein [Planctomycetaceae bacterium]
MKAFLLSFVCLLGTTLVLSAQPKEAQPQAPVADRALLPDSIEVKVIGTLSTGEVAIGGETTGVTIESSGFKWEVDFSQTPELQELAQKLSGAKVQLEGKLVRRAGTEIPNRTIVIATSLQTVTKPKLLLNKRGVRPNGVIRSNPVIKAKKSPTLPVLKQGLDNQTAPPPSNSPFGN